MPCGIHTEWPRHRFEQDPAPRRHVRPTAAGSRTPHDSNCGNDQREDPSTRCCRGRGGAAPVHDHARRRETELRRDHQLDDRRIQRQSEHSKRIPEPGPHSEMISSVIFDLDGTLTKIPSPWQYVHERLGVWETKACSYLEEWLSGKICYEEFCQRDTSLWNGRSIGEIHSYLDEIE